MSVDPRKRTKDWLDTYITAANLTKDDGSTLASYAVMFAYPNYPLIRELYGTQSTSTKILDSGDNEIHGSRFYDGYLWFSTRTSPLRVIKMSPETLEYEEVELDSGYNSGDALEVAEGSIWVVTQQSSSYLIKVNPETLEWEAAITFSGIGYCQTLVYAYGYLWVGGYQKIAKVDLSDLSYTVYDYSAAIGTKNVHSITSGGGYIWATAASQYVLRVDPDVPATYSTVDIGAYSITDDMAYLDGALYFGIESSPYRIYKVEDDLTTTYAQIGSSNCYGVTMHGYLWATYAGSPGVVRAIKTDLSVAQTVTLPSGYNDANEIVFDENGGAYVACFLSPARVVKYTNLDSVDLLYCVGTPETEALPLGIGYLEKVPITIVAVDKTGITGTKMRWKAEAELRRITETYPLGSLRTLTRLSDSEERLGSTTLYSVTYIMHYKRYSG